MLNTDLLFKSNIEQGHLKNDQKNNAKNPPVFVIVRNRGNDQSASGAEQKEPRFKKERIFML